MVGTQRRSKLADCGSSNYMGACSSVRLGAAHAVDISVCSAEIHDIVLKTFDEHDHDSSGAIETKELSTLIEDVMGEMPDEETLLNAAKSMDPNGDGEIAWSEFKDWFFCPDSEVQDKLTAHKRRSFAMRFRGSIDALFHEAL
jgi:hypothetical protein